MRHILDDHSRRHGAAKRDHDKAPFEEALVPAQSEIDLVALNGALESLGRTGPDKLCVVEPRLFGGLFSRGNRTHYGDLAGHGQAAVRSRGGVAISRAERGWSNVPATAA
jgi:hypothetical protein